jgi:hypothetical protein
VVNDCGGAKETPDAIDGTGRQQHDLQVLFAGFVPPVVQ